MLTVLDASGLVIEDLVSQFGLIKVPTQCYPGMSEFLAVLEAELESFLEVVERRTYADDIVAHCREEYGFEPQLLDGVVTNISQAAEEYLADLLSDTDILRV